MSSRRNYGVFVAGLALFTVIAAAMIWFIWSQITEILEGHVDIARDLVALVLLALLIWLLRKLGAWVSRFEPGE